jgi:hypothetical protein
LCWCCCYCCWAWHVLIRYWSFCMVVDDAVLVAAAWFFWAGFGRRRCQFHCVQTYRIDTVHPLKDHRSGLGKQLRQLAEVSRGTSFRLSRDEQRVAAVRAKVRFPCPARASTCCRIRIHRSGLSKQGTRRRGKTNKKNFNKTKTLGVFTNKQQTTQNAHLSDRGRGRPQRSAPEPSLGRPGCSESAAA